MASAQVELPLTAMALPGTVNLKLADFPEPSKAPDVDAHSEAEKVIDALNKAINESDYKLVADLFCKVGFWRDHLMLSWSFRTIHTPANISEFLQECAKSRDGFRLQKITLDKSKPSRQPVAGPVDPKGEVPGVMAFLSVDSKVGTGEGYLRLAQEGGKWKVHTIYTSLRDIKSGLPQKDHERCRQVDNANQNLGRKNWLDNRTAAVNYTDGREPQVLIIGAGQAGLTAAVRLKMQNINALIIEKNDRVGDNWRKRYHQLVLHDPSWYDHLPYLNFPPQWPVFTPKDKLAEWLESYAGTMELNVWTKTEITNAKWDEIKKEWIVTVTRTRENGSTEVRVFRPHHIIQATGQSSEKKQPYIQGMEKFEGQRICHSSEVSGTQEQVQGKKAVVVGSCTSGHDIARDMVERGYDVTMVQRSSTTVVSSRAVTDIFLKGLYSEDGPPVEDSDLTMHGIPTSMLKAIQVEVSKVQRNHDKDLLEGLTRAGFKLDNGPHESGMIFKYFQRAGGYYIDVGTSKLIVDGKIKIKQAQEIAEVLPHGLKFADGSEIEADEIILATGYQSMRMQTRQIFGDEMADRLADVWGFNEEGEWRVLWQRTGHPGFWFHGGSLALCRYYSQLLALQIKGLEEKLYNYDEN